MSFHNILTEVTQNRVGLIQLHRPQTLNALSPELMNELGQALGDFDTDANVGAIVITGNDRAFAAGADIKAMAAANAITMLTDDLIAKWEIINHVNKPIIAAVSGFCLGGGCELAMACDMIVASESAIFGQPEINLGIIPGFGGAQRLSRTIGKALTMEMILTDRRLTAEEARMLGLVNAVYPVDTYLEQALQLAERVAIQAPLAVQLAKEAVNKAFELSLHQGLAHERRLFQILFASVDQKEGMTAFIEKRKPQWIGQ